MVSITRASQSLPRNTYIPENYGAVGDGVTDDLAALQAMYAAGGQSGNYVCCGDYAVSDTWEVDLQRGSLDVRGTIRPHGSFSDYCVAVTRPSGSAQLPHGTLQTLTPSVIRVNGLGQARGVKLQLIDSSPGITIEAEYCYGTCLRTNTVRESQINLTVTNSYHREPAWSGNETVWDSGTSYDVGDYVVYHPADWDSGTTYDPGDRVMYDGACWISKRDFAPNTNNTPGLTSTWWQQFPLEYFECLIAHSNKEPEVYNSFSSASGNRYWQKVYNHEAALDCSSDGDVGDSDNNVWFWVDFHNLDYATFVRITGTEYGEAVRSIKIGGHLHALGNIASLNAAQDAYRQMALRDNTIIIEIAAGYAVTIDSGTNVRPSIIPGGVGLMCGWPSLYRTFHSMPLDVKIIGGRMSGEEDGQCGVLWYGSKGSGPYLYCGANFFLFTGDGASEIISPLQNPSYPRY